MAGEEHGVGEEAGELFEVGGAAVSEVGVGLGGDADGDGRGLHQLGVGGLFAGEDDDGPVLGEQLVEPLLPGADAAEEPYDDEVGALQELRQVFEGEPGGVGEPVRNRAVGRAGAEQVGVGRRQEKDHAALPNASRVAWGTRDRNVRMRRQAFLGVRAPGGWRTAGVPDSRGIAAVLTVAGPCRSLTGFLPWRRRWRPADRLRRRS
ncbi:hypothetical protein GCM10020000_11470 [Streptomyces olivoverticillatus]